jgi:hypothetical protein
MVPKIDISTHSFARDVPPQRYRNFRGICNPHGRNAKGRGLKKLPNIFSSCGIIQITKEYI